MIRALGAETGRVELAREETLKVFERPFFAVATETTRYYLNGIFLHDLDGALVAVGTDAHRLCRVVLPGATGLSQDNRLIVPRSAVKIVVKLLADSSMNASSCVARRACWRSRRRGSPSPRN
jgi:DNA polymerase III subunit beta